MDVYGLDESGLELTDLKTTVVTVNMKRCSICLLAI